MRATKRNAEYLGCCCWYYCDDWPTACGEIMNKSRREDLWSKHTSDHKPAPGTPFASGGSIGAMQQSCIRCGVHRPPSVLEADKQMRYQKRCIDRELCATARGGKS